jgi:hypothetical protein
MLTLYLCTQGPAQVCDGRSISWHESRALCEQAGSANMTHPYQIRVPGVTITGGSLHVGSYECRQMRGL